MLKFHSLSDPFASSRLMLGRAKAHAADLNSQFEAFIQSQPQDSVVEPSADGLRSDYKLKFPQGFPASFSLVASDCAYNLRSALDQIGYAMARAKKPGSEPFNTIFPFCRISSEFDNVLAKNCRDIPSEIQDSFRRLKPYRGGDDLLWSLSEINNRNKHRLLVPMGSAIRSSTINGMSINLKGGGGTGLTVGPQIWNRLTNEILLFSTPITADVSGPQVQINLDLTFDDIEILRGYPARGVLNGLILKVESILAVVEKDARDAGLISPQ
jgi:hypothetical protein